MSEPLGRVLDPDALDESEGARGRYRIEVPARWTECGEEIELSVPARLACARCDGGGCDRCHRSGVVRGPDDPSARTIRVRLPPGKDEGFSLRIARPFGESAAIEQLILEITQGDHPSHGVVLVKRLEMDRPKGGRSSDPWQALFWPAIVIAIAIGLLLAAQR